MTWKDGVVMRNDSGIGDAALPACRAGNPSASPQPEAVTDSANERTISIPLTHLAPHVRIMRAGRNAVVFERAE